GAVIAAKASHGAAEAAADAHLVAFGVYRWGKAAESVVCRAVVNAVLRAKFVSGNARANGEPAHIGRSAVDAPCVDEVGDERPSIGEAFCRRPVLGIAAFPEAEVADVLDGVAKGLQDAELAKRALGVRDASAT